ncbi:MAG: hypothetical protein ACR2NN_05885 [Bryobacteraceae bacterium]
MRCLYCGKQLALFRRLTVGGEFCSEAHKQSYHEEYNKLALGRLLQAQSKPEDIKVPAPAPDVRATLKNATKAIEAPLGMSRDSESGWTTVHKNNPKLQAPAQDSVLAPPKPGFLLDKPEARSGGTGETEPAPTLHLAISSSWLELRHPQLDCKLVEYKLVDSQVDAPPRATDLLMLTGAFKATPQPAAAQLAEVPSVVETVPAPISRDIPGPATAHAGFAPVGVLPSEVLPALTAKPEPELEAALAFSFACNFEEPASVCFLAGAIELPEDNVVDLSVIGNGAIEGAQVRRESQEGHRYALAGLLALTIHPIVPLNLEPAIRLMPFSTGNGALVLPLNSPLPLRPKVAATAPGRVLRTHPASLNGNTVNTEPASTGNEADEDLPAFLRTKSGGPKKSMLGNVQTYFKKIVSCLIIAGLGGGVYSHFRTGPVLSVAPLSQPDARNYGAGLNG